ncbi:hypothetical protein L4D20_09940 [Vibrio kyushuensis]|uniref:hypothetical protein n=1 Tax=Vibrio kyushuensis TaxID=2910249 RepID=UPI003D0F9CE7
MRILYIDLHGLLYSFQYLQKAELLSSFQSQMPFHTRNALLNSVAHDSEGAKRLAEAASEASLLLYPICGGYTRDLLVKHNIFAESQLAPYIDLTLRMRPDDNDAVRQLIVHACALNADHWYVCGDITCDERFESFPGRTLTSRFEDGFSDELISKILATKVL